MKLALNTTGYKPNRLYLIEFRDDTGYYIKCGKSSGSSSDDRFFGIIKSYVIAHGGNCAYAKMLRDVEVDDVFKRETEFHHKFAEKRHYPLHSFSGSTELFAITKEEALLEFDLITGKQYDRATTKVCYTCKEEKSTIEFHANKAKKDGLNHSCKVCTNNSQKSFNSLPYRMFNNQIEHSRYRGHPRPAYTYEEFKSWVMAQPHYKELYDNYKDSGYDKNLVPSVDRLDPNKPYSFDNIELVTFKENMKRNGEHRLTASGNKVLVFKCTGEFVAEFPSNNSAADALCNGNDISDTLDNVLSKGKLSTSYGYCFVSKHKENEFCSNGWLMERFRSTRKAEIINANPENTKDAYDKLLAGELDGRYEDNLGCVDGADAE